ncbi:MAG: carbamoyltransferase HypF [Candidatus Aminicenantales bacterium]
MRRGKAVRITVFGVVQGVGFRPFVFRLADQFGLKGWVQNIGTGVKIHAETQGKADFSLFCRAIKENRPPLARIEKLSFQPASFRGYKDFTVKKTRKSKSFVFISPDISTCQNCQQEILSPQERRYHYPFTNCTDCGPRYTIVKALPYDRGQTTMAGFQMCSACAAEYENPHDRRYHAQPIACPDCGPDISLKEAKSGSRIPGGIEKAARLIKKGKILAVKGLGGFHLVCDALNPAAVSRLRRIKNRKTKPLALMAADIGTVEKYAFLSSAETEALCSSRRPIVLLKKKKDLPGIAPHLDEMGFMLPYTPLHYLLLQDIPLIVATSSNPKDSPIMKEEKEGIPRICDYILSHNRPIQMRADDSVLKMVHGQPLFLRRARGYVPYPQRVPAGLESSHSLLALGGELKDTISVYKNGYVITSQFLGDLDEYANRRYFEETISHLLHLFDAKPHLVVSDLHPHFHTTRWAQKIKLPHLQVQHHFAHILAVLLEHQIPLSAKVLGVALDGYGYGADHSAWGGEFLLAGYAGYERIAHFKPVPLPGGDLAAKQPWRMALAYLQECGSPPFPEIQALEKLNRKKIRGVLEMMKRKVNSPLTSSCGRLFDAVSFLLGLAPLENEFEAEAAMRLESAASLETDESYPFSLMESVFPVQVFFSDTISAILQDIQSGQPAALIATKFHNTLARMILHVAERARKNYGVQAVALGGGVFLNKRLLQRAVSYLERNSFQVLRPLLYSPNDESLSLGQVAYALATLKGKPAFNLSD